MVAVGTSTLAQRQKIVLGQRLFANNMPMMLAMLEKNNKWKYLFFDLKGHLLSRCQMQN